MRQARAGFEGHKRDDIKTAGGSRANAIGLERNVQIESRRRVASMTKLAEAERDAFLSKTRLGILNTVNADGFPLGVPVWFDWDGEVVRIFTVATSQKVQRIEADSRASLLVVNDLSELERWVSFDGNVTVVEQGGIELAEKLAGRYWDLRDPAKKETLAAWRKAADALRVLELRPERIRTYKD